MKISLFVCILACGAASACTQNAQSAKSGIVKKSETGICHAPGGSYYDQTKKFTSFSTLDDCLKSGGRLPKR